MQIKHRQPLLRGTNALIPPLQGDVRQPEIEELEAAAPWGKGIFATYGVAAERGVGPSSAVVAFKLDSRCRNWQRCRSTADQVENHNVPLHWCAPQLKRYVAMSQRHVPPGHCEAAQGLRWIRSRAARHE